MELQQILSKMEADGWEISNDFKIAHGHFLQYFLETVEAALRQPPVSGQLLLKKLETKLNTSGSYSIPYHEDSIMTYGKICDHDDGYLCEHRREWIEQTLKHK